MASNPISNIKDFFKKKKLDTKFKMAGSGHRLTDNNTSSTGSTSMANTSTANPKSHTYRENMSKQKAGEAAIERIQRQNQSNTRNTTLENILQQEKQKIREEYKAKEQTENIMKEEEKLVNKYKDIDSKQRFTCPTIELNESLELDQLIERMCDYIQMNFTEDLTLMSALMIVNCNHNIGDNAQQRVSECIKVLDKVVTNLMTSSVEEREKFSKIRKSKIQNKVLDLKGGLEFLSSIGFQSDSSDDWLVFQFDEITDICEQMIYYKDVLNNVEQFPLIIDRQVVHLNTEQSFRETDLSQDFFKLSADEVKREMQSLTDKRETEETLRTKAMKEHKQRKIDSKYTRLRFNCPNGVKIEATFGSNEILCDVKNWLLAYLESIDKFNLKCGTDVFTDEHLNKTLKDLNLVPTAMLFIIS
ncbi:UBX domain-containing protein 6-like [Oppia nitens]|uniref:UBX domain-containing protein 6-like n=1 Tax=Oppia nitens TaxID=1686743 RepID=UPI0023DCE348|nr:UBX domain-containing protein 6-like [Oppia nitens]